VIVTGKSAQPVTTLESASGFMLSPASQASEAARSGTVSVFVGHKEYATDYTLNLFPNRGFFVTLAPPPAPPQLKVRR